MTALTRGPLPARVYWTRRVLLLVVVTALVVGLVQLVALAVGGGSTTPPDRAAPVAAAPTETASPEVPAEAEPTRPRPEGPRKKRTKDREPVLALPEGPCVDRDVAVTPTVGEAVGGRPVTFVLELRTISSPACTWEVSPQSLSVKVTSGDDAIWFSSQCPRSVPRSNVVLRNNETTEVEVAWSSKRSSDDCVSDEWALPGWYHVEAAALAGEPSDLQFELTAPEAEVQVEKVRPPKEPKRDRQQDEQEQDRKNRG